MFKRKTELLYQEVTLDDPVSGDTSKPLYALCHSDENKLTQHSMTPEHQPKTPGPYLILRKLKTTNVLVNWLAWFMAQYKQLWYIHFWPKWGVTVKPGQEMTFDLYLNAPLSSMLFSSFLSSRKLNSPTSFNHVFLDRRSTGDLFQHFYYLSKAAAWCGP